MGVTDYASILSVLVFVGALIWVAADRRILKKKLHRAETSAAALRIELAQVRSKAAEFGPAGRACHGSGDTRRSEPSTISRI